MGFPGLVIQAGFVHQHYGDIVLDGIDTMAIQTEKPGTIR
jgi:hypothetical protein